MSGSIGNLSSFPDITRSQELLDNLSIALVASPVIIGPVAMLGFLDNGGTDAGQAIYRRTNNTGFTRG